MHPRLSKFLLLFAVLFFPVVIHAQKSEIYRFEDKDYYKGLELFEKEKYAAASRFFGKVIENPPRGKSEIKSEARYYQAICAIELMNNDAEYKVFLFASEYPESPLINHAHFRLADYLYQKKNYARAIEYYEKVDRFLLDQEELSQYYFQKGYSHYMRNDYEEARVAFYEIKDISSTYSSPALYYYSHIAYEQENYQTALEGFIRLIDDETFSEVAPYYIGQIYYLQKKYQELIDFAPVLMENVTEKRKDEMSKIIGEAYFYLERYEESIPYLQSYMDGVGRAPIRDRYQLGYAYYMTGDYEKAATIFERITMTKTEISQSALYHLADCYVNMGDKVRARTAFGSASRMEFIPDITEDALFNYAKLTYELSYSPFNEAIRTFNAYIRMYPASPRIDEAYNFLVMAYLNTRNYRMALESLEKISKMNPEIERAYQKVAFFRGLELFTDQRFSDAMLTFGKSLEYGSYSSVIKARTLCWLAESYLRERDTETAEDYYRLFLEEPAAFQSPEYKKVNYSMGYLEFARENYGEAEKWFRQYINTEANKGAVTVADAYNRIGDCRFIATAYRAAIDNYERVIGMKKANVDYAYFQKGFSLGLLDLPREKIETLQTLIKEYPGSTYVDDALFEIGRSYVLLGDPRSARASYERILGEFPNSNYTNKTLVQLGLIFRNAGDNSEAMTYYKRVVEEYPGTPEATNALRTIRDIYVDLNNVDGYLSYVEDMGQGVSVSEQDSLLYSAAESLYLQGECEQAVRNLDNYIERFERGVFLLNAHFYRADCLLKLNRGEEARASLNYIIDQPVSMFTEPALMAAARFAYRDGNYARSAELYRKVTELGGDKSNITEAETGLMRSYAKLDEYQNTIEAANQVLLQDKLAEAVQKEATFRIGRAYYMQNDMISAYDWFSRLGNEVNSEFGAEARYRMAEIDFNRGRVEESEEIVYDIIDKNTPHQYWMGKTFLLLSDIFLEKDDDFQAVQTLESIISYYTVEDDGIKQEALQKKSRITDRVNEENREAERDTLEINLDEI